MLPFGLVVYVLLLHWAADFVLQSDRMAKGKSSSFLCLLDHVEVYSLAIFLGLLLSGRAPVGGILVYAAVNGACHLGIDFATSRVNFYLWGKGKVHYFFVSVGFDQFLHTGILLATIRIIS